MSNPSKEIMVIILAGLLLFEIGVGCRRSPAPPAPSSEPSFQMESSIEVESSPIKEESLETVSEQTDYLHIVRWPGENLSLIAQWYTGDPSHWHELVAANPEIKPRQLFIGTRILIPAHLLKTHEPLPQDFVK